MRKADLPNCPKWLRDARTENEDVKWWNDNQATGYVVWLGGVWLGGDWHGGVWHGGDWRGGVWLGGVWLGGDWHGGDWHGGVWHGGVWRGGDWHGGVWLGGVWLGGVWHGGVWHGGVWRGGDWRGGVWLGGDWHGGVWHGGRSAIRSPWFVCAEKDGTISIGCKNKTRAQWDAWFAGTEEYSHKRGTPLFRMIHAHYLAMCTWIDATAEPVVEAPKKKPTRKKRAKPAAADAKGRG